MSSAHRLSNAFSPSNGGHPILLGTAADLPILVREVPRPAWALINRFWPGPLTLVLPARDTVSRSITRDFRSVAVRVPAGRTTLLLLEALGEPIIGTSANRHGEPPAITGAEAAEALGGEINAVLVDDDVVVAGTASTELEIGEDAAQIHREGALSADTIRRALGPRFPVKR